MQQATKITELTKEIIQLDDRMFQAYVINKHEPWDYCDLINALKANGYTINAVNQADGWVRFEGEI